MDKRDAILVTNIGNRNLKFNGKYFNELDIKVDFKSLTQELWRQLEAGLAVEVEVTLSDLLLPLLEKHHERIQRIILLGSNQEGVPMAKTAQDTLWAANIAAKLIGEKYGLPVAVESNRVFATDADNQLHFALTFIRNQYKHYPNMTLIVLDAGGTPQQKQALKIAASFVWPEPQLEIYNQNIHENTARVVDNSGQRDLILLGNIIKLIEESEFEAARYSLEELRKIQLPKLMHMLTFADYRLKLLTKNAKSEGDKGKKVLGEKFFELFVKPYKEGNNGQQKMIALLPQIQLSADAIKGISFLSMERLHLAQLYWYKLDLTRFVLSLHQFIEGFVNASLKAILGYDLEKNYEASMKSIMELMEKEHADFYRSYLIKPNGQPVNGLPGLIRIAHYLLNEEEARHLKQFMASLVDLFFPINQKSVGLNNLRNDIAHRGIGVTEKSLSQILPSEEADKPLARWNQLMEEWFHLFGLPQENIYHTMANHMIAFIRNGSE